MEQRYEWPNSYPRCPSRDLFTVRVLLRYFPSISELCMKHESGRSNGEPDFRPADRTGNVTEIVLRYSLTEKKKGTMNETIEKPILHYEFREYFVNSAQSILIY